MKFSKNQRVSLVKNPIKKGRVDNVLRQQGGHQFYEIQWDSGDLQVLAEHDLIRL